MKQIIAVGSIGLLLLAGCATPLTPRESGTLTGAGVGAAAGAALGGIAGSPGKGAAIGAGVGALTGLLAGNAIQDEQAAHAARPYPPRYAYAAPPPGYQVQYPPPPPPTASLQIEVTPVEAAILVDGILMERTKESKGPVTVPVADGVHTVAFRVGGATTMENIVVSPQTTVLIKRTLVTTGAPQQ